MTYLIEFDYDYYCQGIETAYTTVLVRHAKSPEDACEQITICGKWKNPRNFVDNTV